MIASSFISPQSLLSRPLQSPARSSTPSLATTAPVRASADSVSLGSLTTASPALTPPLVPNQAAPAAEAPAAPKEIRGTVDLKPADLAKAIANPEALAILQALDPKIGLSDLSAALFKMDPAAADDSTFQLKYFKNETYSHVTLASTRLLSNGKTVSEAQLGAGTNRPPDQVLTPRVSLQYRPDTFPTYQQLPDPLQKAWSKVYAQSPQQLAEETRAMTGDIGTISDLNFYLADSDQDKPYLMLHWSGKSPDGVITSVRKAAKELNLSVTLTPEQLKAGQSLPASLQESWSKWQLQPIEVANRMLQGAKAQARHFQIGVSHSESQQNKLTLGSSLVGDIEGKQHDAGQVSFSFYETTDDQGKTSRVAYHNLLSFTEQFQGHGLAKSILRNNFDLYKEIGIDKVDLTAAITVGGYAWARYGWQLKPDDVKSGRLDKQIHKRLETLELQPKDRKVVDAILASQDGKKVWALSDLKTPVTKNGEETTLAKALLLGTNWSGTFDMHDSASLQRLERYLGKS